MRARLRTVIAVAALALASPVQPASPEAISYLDNALALLRAQHINSPKADWPAIIEQAHRAATSAQTPGDTHGAIWGAIEALGERHTFLRLPESARPATGNGGAAPASRPEPSMPHVRIAGEGVVLAWLPALDTVTGAPDIGARYTATLERGLTAHADAARCGWIVDLRDNGGGDMWPMLNGLDPLLGRDPFGTFILAQGSVPWVRTAQHAITSMGGLPSAAPRYTLPHHDARLALLLGPDTASSGEMTALALIGRDGVRSFGQPTAGFTTANRVERLADGAILAITVSKVSARDGVAIDGPIRPDVELPLEEAEGAALAWLQESC